MNTAELAKQLGISRGTISRVLNNHPNVKAETRQRVLDALKEYSYTPNETARSLVMMKKIRLAIIVFSEPAFFWNKVESGVAAALNEIKSFGGKVDYFVTDILNPKEQVDLLRKLPAEGYDGIAIAPNNPALVAGEIEALSNSGFPVVIINVEIPSVSQLCYIGCDYIQAGKLAAELFVKTLSGSRKITVLTLKETVSSVDQRIAGFCQELSHYENIKINRICRFNRTAKDVYEELLKLLNTTNDIDGIYVAFSALEQTAQAILDSSSHQHPIVIGYDLNNKISDYLKSGTITATICHEPFNQGYFAVKILHHYLSHAIIPNSSKIYNKLEIIMALNVNYYIDENMHLDIFGK